MEDDKKRSVFSEETPNELAEIVQREAELIKEPQSINPEEEADMAIPREQTEELAIEGDSADADLSTEKSVDPVPNPNENGVIDSVKDKVEDSETVESSAVSKNDPEVSTDGEVNKSETAPAEISHSPESEEEVSGASQSEKRSDEDEEDHHEQNEYDEIDLDKASRKELLELLRKIQKEDNLRKVDRIFKEIGTHFETAFEDAKKVAQEEFLSVEGNDEAHFEFKGDELDREFHALYDEQKHKRSHFFHQLEKQKEDNLSKKNQILDLIREIVDGEDQTSFNRVKSLQEEWKKVGPVSGGQNRTLWANYHALMDRFYDQRTIYFELKDLDRKKNLEAKLKLCKKVEALDAEKDLKSAIVQLNEFHEEFKHIGPVPKENQEPLWQRFKTASDKIYEHRKEYTELQKEEHAKNLVIKQSLAQRAGELSSFTSDRIKDWNRKTKDLLALQKEWEACGGVPRENAKEVNKAFWGNFKQFFANKNKFFKSLDAQREDNLKKKHELLAKAKDLKESTDWEKTAAEFKDLQSQWKDIGPIPEKLRISVYEEFRGHCDDFFEKRRGQNAEQNQEFFKNLENKRAILDELESLSKSEQMDLQKVYDLTEKFSEIGLVPRNAVGKTLDRYDTISKKLLLSDLLSDVDKSELRIHLDVCKLKNSPHGNQKLNRKETAIRRKITGLENDINNWRTNIDFFAKSKNADQLKKEIEEKITESESELESLKRQLDYLH